LTEQDITYIHAEARTAKVEKLWRSFNDNQTQLEILRTKKDVQLEEIIKRKARR